MKNINVKANTTVKDFLSLLDDGTMIKIIDESNSARIWGPSYSHFILHARSDSEEEIISNLIISRIKSYNTRIDIAVKDNPIHSHMTLKDFLRTMNFHFDNIYLTIIDGDGERVIDDELFKLNNIYELIYGKMDEEIEYNEEEYDSYEEYEDDKFYYPYGSNSLFDKQIEEVLYNIVTNYDEQRTCLPLHERCILVIKIHLR